MKKYMIFLIVISIFFSCSESRLIPTPVEQERPEFDQMIAPQDSAFSYDREAAITMRFNEKMDPTTFPGNFFLWEDEVKTTAVTGSFSASGNDIIFTPATPLLKANEYFTELRARVRDINGNGIDKDTLTVLETEFFTSGDFCAAGSPEFFISNGSEDIMYKSYVKDNLLTADSALSLDGFGRQLEMAFTLDGSRLILTDYNTSNSGIYFLNPETNIIENILTQNPGDAGQVNKSAEIVVSDVKAYVVNQSSKMLSVVHLSTETIIDAILLPGTPKGMAILPDYSKIYLGSATDNQVWVVNTADNSVENTLIIDGFTQSARLAASPDGNYVIVREFRGTRLAFIETATGNIAGLLDIGYEAKSGNNNDLAVAGDYVYVNSSTGELTKVQISTRSIVAEITHVNFQGIDIYPGGELLIAAVRDIPAKIAVIIPANLKIIRLIEIGGTAPWDVAIRPTY